MGIKENNQFTIHRMHPERMHARARVWGGIGGEGQVCVCVCASPGAHAKWCAPVAVVTAGIYGLLAMYASGAVPRVLA